MASKPKPPKPTDPNEAAAAQARWNRTGQVTPFGSVTWEGDNQVSKPSEQMMALFGRAQELGMKDNERYKPPENAGDIRSQIMARLQNHEYGGKPYDFQKNPFVSQWDGSKPLLSQQLQIKPRYVQQKPLPLPAQQLTVLPQDLEY